jgi:putative sigma-54 modulation protein
MDIEYTGRQTVISKKLKTQTEAGLARIAKLVGRTARAHVFLTADKYRRNAEVTLKTRGKSLVAACEATEMETALHDALWKLEQQIVRHNQKRTAEKRHSKASIRGVEAEPGETVVLTAPGRYKNGAAVKNLGGAAKNGANTNGAGKNGTGKNGTGRKAVPMVVHSFPSKTPLIEPHVVRSIDSAAMRPMSLEEAVKEAAFRDRDVFVFRDKEGQVMVLHRKKDGKMELIQVP